jgi:hypothetical protein
VWARKQFIFYLKLSFPFKTQYYEVPQISRWNNCSLSDRLIENYLPIVLEEIELFFHKKELIPIYTEPDSGYAFQYIL